MIFVILSSVYQELDQALVSSFANKKHITSIDGKPGHYSYKDPCKNLALKNLALTFTPLSFLYTEAGDTAGIVGDNVDNEIVKVMCVCVLKIVLFVVHSFNSRKSLSLFSLQFLCPYNGFLD